MTDEQKLKALQRDVYAAIALFALPSAWPAADKARSAYAVADEMLKFSTFKP